MTDVIEENKAIVRRCFTMPIGALRAGTGKTMRFTGTNHQATRSHERQRRGVYRT